MSSIKERRKARYSKRKIQSNDDLYKSTDPSVSIDSPLVPDIAEKETVVENTTVNKKFKRKRKKPLPVEEYNYHEKLIESGVDLLVVDTAHGHSKKVLNMIKELSRFSNSVDILGGNVATPDGTKALIDSGADVVKIGIGPGSICTTRLVAGIGVPQLSAILSVRNGLRNKNVKIISDGGIKYSGDLAKAFAAGADAVMIGSLFAGTDEAPGKLIKKNGKLFKSFRGMGSVGAMNKGSADRYFQTKQKDSSKYVPEGVEGFIKYKGTVSKIIYKLVGGLRSSMGYLGCKQIKNLKNKPKFVKITKAGFYESMVHNIDKVIR